MVTCKSDRSPDQKLRQKTRELFEKAFGCPPADLQIEELHQSFFLLGKAIFRYYQIKQRGGYDN